MGYLLAWLEIAVDFPAGPGGRKLHMEARAAVLGEARFESRASARERHVALPCFCLLYTSPSPRD
eukprot:10869494-Alexandrium_andersonii.AAC.1